MATCLTNCHVPHQGIPFDIGPILSKICLSSTTGAHGSSGTNGRAQSCTSGCTGHAAVEAADTTTSFGCGGSENLFAERLLHLFPVVRMASLRTTRNAPPSTVNQSINSLSSSLSIPIFQQVCCHPLLASSLAYLGTENLRLRFRNSII